MRTSSGVNYDAIAHLYDSQPYRAKAVDPELIKFKERCACSDTRYQSSILPVRPEASLWQIVPLSVSNHYSWREMAE